MPNGDKADYKYAVTNSKVKFYRMCLKVEGFRCNKLRDLTNNYQFIKLKI